jgi:branched-chain amino acid transport system permease protein
MMTERVADPMASAAKLSQTRSETIAFVLMLAVIVIAPFFVYPVFLMKALCFALFACAFNLLIGYGGLLSFGHALFFGWASYFTAHAAKVWGLTPELAILTGTAGAAALGLVVAPFFIYPLFLMQALCFALFACAFNLLIGYVGLLSFGHALYFGWASYLAAHAAKVWGFPPELAILTGAATGALLGLIAGSLAIRRQGIYFAMITLALAQMMFFFALQAKFTGGEDGIQAVPRGKLFGLVDLSSHMTMYALVVVIFLACFLLILRIINSPFGEVLKAIRENEPRAISLGYKTDRYKLVAFVLSATLAGVAGGTKAIVFQIASLTDVHWTMSGEVVLMTRVGGLGTVFGPVLGAFVIVAMQSYLNALDQWVTVIQGAIFVVCVLLFRRGVVGEIANLLRIKL